MLSKIALFVLACFAVLFAAANPDGLVPHNGDKITQSGKKRLDEDVRRRGDSPSQAQCNVGNMQCCQSTYQSNSPAGAFLLGALGVPIQNLITTVGFDCSPITAAVLGGAAGTGSKCSAQPVCCNQILLDGLVNNACIPLNMQVL